MALAVDLSKKSLAVITGASQGIGRALAVELSKCLCKDSKIIIIARSEPGLKETKELISNANKEVSVKIISLDLTEPTEEQCASILDQDLNADQALIFHNVGQVGKLSSAVNLTDLQNWRDYFDLNVFSVGILNAILIKKLKNIVKKLVVVNITSLAGRQPFLNMAMYGSGKAARDVYFRVLAIEEPYITVLNYSPGPIDTSMFHEVIATTESDELRACFIQTKANALLTPVQTVGMLLSILRAGNFKSGDTIDYYDRL